MTATDEAVEATACLMRDYRLGENQPGGYEPNDHDREAARIVLGYLQRSKHLIARDDREGLIEALGLTQVGIRHDYTGGVPHVGRACPACKPIYTLEEQ